MTWRISIPGWRPAFANELRGHPMRVARLKRRDADMLTRARLVYAVPVAAGKRRVRITISGRYGRFPDPDAPIKSFLDACKRSGLIVDDAAAWCQWLVPEFRRGPKKTVIEIEDVEQGEENPC